MSDNDSTQNKFIFMAIFPLDCFYRSIKTGKIMLNTDNNLNFKGMFALQGTKTEVQQMVNFIKNDKIVEYFDDKFVSGIKNGKKIIETHVISTNNNVLENKSFSPQELYNKVKDIVVKAKDFFNPKKISFNAEYGYLNLKKSQKVDDLVFKYSESNYKKAKTLTGIHFDKALPLNEAIVKLDKFYYDTNHPFNESMQYSQFIYFNLSASEINQTLLKNVKVKGLIGHGVNASVFDLGKNVLKISRSPICPKEMTTLDIPYLKTDVIEIPSTKKKLYYCIQPKAEITDVKEISNEEYAQFLAELKKIGYENASDLGKHQIGRYNGKLYLLDYESIRKSNGELDREMIE